MLWQVAISLIFILIAAWEVTSKKIKCEDGGHFCTASSVDGIPWTGHSSRTAPSVRSMKAGHFIHWHKGKRHIRVLVEWQAFDMMSDIRGYNLEVVSISPPGGPKFYVFNLTDSWHDWSRKRQNLSEVIFQFNCCGDPKYSQIGPNYEYLFSLTTSPMYREEDKPNKKEISVSIPGCEDKCITRTHFCKGYNGRRRERKFFPRKVPNESANKEAVTIIMKGDGSAVHIVLTASCGSLVLVFVLTAILLQRKSAALLPSTPNKKESTTVRRHVTVVNSPDERFLPAINRLTAILQKFEHIDLTVNIRQKIEIGSFGLKKWAEKNIKDADFVIFTFASNQDFECCIKDLDGSQVYSEVAAVVKTAESLVLTKKILDGQSKFLAVDLNNCMKEDQMAYCKHYKMARDLKKFLKHVLGDQHYKAVLQPDKEMFISLLETAAQDNNPSLMEQNDLGDSPDSSERADVGHEAYVPNTANYHDPPDHSDRGDSMQDAYFPNIANSYITTDFNIEESHTQGARPKRVQ